MKISLFLRKMEKKSIANIKKRLNKSLNEQGYKISNLTKQ